MNGAAFFLYRRAAVPLALAGYRLFGRFNEKARDFFAIREGMFAKLEAWDRGRPARPRVLVHVASVGELLEAIPVMKAIRALPEPPEVVLSHTSASVVKNLPKETAAELITPSPLDRPEEVGRFLDLTRPGLIVFSSYDLWAGFVAEADRRKIPLVLVNARLPAVSGRLRWPGRVFFAGVHKPLAVVGAIDADSASRFPLLGVPAEKVRVTGNCRFDQTLDRCRKVAADDPDVAVLPRFDFTFVAGSTWPEDQEHLLPALAATMEREPGMGAVIAPHEPSESRVSAIEAFFRGRGVKSVRYLDLKSGREAAGARVVVVNAMGVLFKLYRRGSAAYVGGSFRQGVHNVMEPAGMGLPVMVGPVHMNSPEAVKMIADGGAATAANAAGMEAVLEAWVRDREARGKMGARALGLVENSAGASVRTMDLIKPYLPGGGR